MMAEPLDQAVCRSGTNRFYVTCLHAADCCDEGWIDIAGETRSRCQLKNGQSHL